MKLEKYDAEKHEHLIMQWWQSRKNIDFPLDILPETGFVASSEGKNLAALFLWSTNSKMCIITAPVANPETTEEERDLALQELYDKLHEEAKLMGHNVVWTTAVVPRVKARLESFNYIKGSDNITEYIKRLE